MYIYIMAAKTFEQHDMGFLVCDMGPWLQHCELCHLLYSLAHFRAQLLSSRTPLRGLACSTSEERGLKTQLSIKLFHMGAC